MLITVQPRYVAAPWELERGEVRRIVGREDHVTPDPGPLAEYLAAFPDRYVAWDYHYQLFAVYVRASDGGPDELHERLFYWDAAPDPVTGEELTDEQLAAMAGKDPSVVRRYRPFDYPFVRQRLREGGEYARAGAARYSRIINDRNASRARSKLKDLVRNQAAALGEIRTWLPVLADAQATGRWNPGVRTPVVPGASFPTTT